jgi:RNA polymerase sigma-70 factor (ECF subfamily)
MSAEDLHLVERAKRGDREAFGELVKKYQRRVYSAAFHMTGQHGDADDVAQEAFVRAWRALPSFDGRSEFTTWLHRITINAALNHLRSRRRAPTLPPPVVEDPTDPELPVFGGGPGDSGENDSAQAKEIVTAVVKALSELSPTLRITLILATIEDMPYKQIAQALEIPEGTVAWRVNQARRLMRQKLAAFLPESAQGNMDEVLRRAKASLGAQ